MKIALLLMIKDEVRLLEAWLEYHAHLFGSESIFIFDNGSVNPETLKILANWERRLGGVDYTYSKVENYKEKPQIYIKKFRELESLGFEFLFPMDCDEFIAVDVDGRIAIDRSSVLEELKKYANSKHSLRIKYALDNSPLANFEYFKIQGQKKCFFYNGVCKASDHGFHDSESFEFGLVPLITNIIYFHYHFRNYDDYMRCAQDKLSAWSSDFEADSLIQYKLKKFPGHHLIDNVILDRDGYYKNQKMKLFQSKVITADDFKIFMVARNLLINEDLDLDMRDFLSKEELWNVHVDDYLISNNSIQVNGWAFNSNGVEINSIKLRLNDLMTVPPSSTPSDASY